jgi:hypothetical protein
MRLTKKGNPHMSTAADKTTDRLTVRLPSCDLERLRELARQRNTDVAALGREAIRVYLDGADPQAAQAQLVHELRIAMREQADRVIDRHDQVTRALITALNQPLNGKSP